MSDIKTLLVESARCIEEALSEYVSGGQEQYRVIYDAMSYSLLAGGKRLRPFLTLQFAALGAAEGGVEAELAKRRAIPYAAALEMIHTYSLIHDDLPCMDNDELRRGKPTCHIKFGEANALLAGDGLLTMAFGTAVKNSYATAEENCRAVALLSECAGADGMIGGQILDLMGERERLDFETLKKLQALKTGELIRAAVTLGCIAGGGSRELLSAAEKYAAGIGRAFQVVDDILDATGDEATLGKPIGSDKDKGKTTFLSYMTVKEASEYAKELTAEAKSAICSYKGSDALILLADYLLERKN